MRAETAHILVHLYISWGQDSPLMNNLIKKKKEEKRREGGRKGTRRKECQEIIKKLLYSEKLYQRLMYKINVFLKQTILKLLYDPLCIVNATPNP